ncbi:hypothetical protein ColKHC_12663 [Colletotrichum higginsianum]|nr:hypothetical protein ColKHC_12663 [Colletotrichum higginsianum]
MERQAQSSTTGVLNRHESLAANLGAKLTGPRLLKAMEGAFEGPIITNPPPAYGTAPVGWLDIVTFAKTNPDKFVLTTGHDGERTCQFYLNGLQVQILEDDWRLIMNGALDSLSTMSEGMFLTALAMTYTPTFFSSFCRLPRLTLLEFRPALGSRQHTRLANTRHLQQILIRTHFHCKAARLSCIPLLYRSETRHMTRHRRTEVSSRQE